MQPRKSDGFKLPPPGSHIATCYGVVGMGTQSSPQFDPSYKVMFLFELPFEKIETDNGSAPMTIFREFSCYAGPKAALRVAIQSWRGKEFDDDSQFEAFHLEKCVGQHARLTIVHKKKGDGTMGARIESFCGLGRGDGQVPPPFNAPIHYEVEWGANHVVFKKLPHWIQRKIAECEEWQSGDLNDQLRRYRAENPDVFSKKQQGQTRPAAQPAPQPAPVQQPSPDPEAFRPGEDTDPPSFDDNDVPF
jgi:hypothetical protein